MKTKLLIPVVAVLFCLFAASCEKCMTCQYTHDQYRNGMWDNISETEEFCGTTDEVKEKEDAFKANANNADYRNKSVPTCWKD